ncbi:MAG: hypothetical protein KAR21_19840 [Spirochaetales bacterium]|nr:hypothetical protein [Spirochaetales bacterium]
MRKHFLLLILLLIPVLSAKSNLSSGLFCIYQNMDIKERHHDFSGNSWSYSNICNPCHIPTQDNLTEKKSPLWKSPDQSNEFTVFTRIKNELMGEVTSSTKLCLSCHDGAVAFENHGGTSKGTFYLTFETVSTDLSGDHPVGFIYDDRLALANGSLYDPSSTPSGLGGTIEDDLLEDGILSCTTCHDAHVERNSDGCSGCHEESGTIKPVMHSYSLSLKIPMEGSRLCLTCHAK